MLIELLNFNEQTANIESGIENFDSRSIEVTDGKNLIKSWNSIGIRAKVAMYDFLGKLSAGNLENLAELEGYIDENNIGNEANLETVKNIVKVKSLQRIKKINILN